MIKLNLVQGTKEWLDTRLSHFTASEAPAMMGVSKHISRTQLLDHKKGWTTEVDAFTQKLFDAGHQVEEMARPLAETFTDEDLVPVVGVLDGTKYLASFDGISMLGDILFEHKMFNKVLAENVLNSVLTPEYYWQLEHQLMVSESDKVLFVCSDGTEDKFYSMWYESVPERRAELIAGWEQFEKDLAVHEPKAKTEKVIAQVSKDLPMITYQMDGMALTSNLSEFKSAALKLVDKANQEIETDQDFANAEAHQKVFTKAEKDIDSLCDRVLGEVQDISVFVNDLREIKELIRQARLAENKQIKTRKEEIRQGIAASANKALSDYAINAMAELKVACPSLSVDVVNAMKGKKTVASLQDAADSELAKGKIEVDGYAKTASSNLATLKEFAADYRFLFADWKDIAFKQCDDFTALVKTRISDHKESEKARIDAEREKIRLEEEAKAQAKIKEEAEQAERQRQKAELEAKRLQSETDEKLVVDDSQKSETNHMRHPMDKQQPREVATRQVQKKTVAMTYEPLAQWPSDMDRAENETLDEICNQLAEAEDYIEYLKSNIHGVAA